MSDNSISSETGMSAETVRLVNKVTINAPIETVWETLTKPGVVMDFFFGSVMHTTELAPGAPVHMRTPNGKYTGVVGEVIEFDPPRLFSMTFRFTNYDDPECIVRHELKDLGGSTEYTLTSEQVPAGTKTEKQMTQGGKFIAETLKSVIEKGRPPMGTRMILMMIKMFAPFTPKVCRAENWPMKK
jgi:uncharacterized protein YndB with AHSA1/START domain